MADENQKLGQYTLLEKIAQGGMAQVFKAKTIDPKGIERLVVIKRILPHISSNAQYVQMLIDEAKIAVNFTHGNIAQVYDLGCISEDYFIVMEYVDGKTLGQIFKKLNEQKSFFPLEVLLYVFIEVCYGLSYVHRRKGPDGKNLGVVHRDISPQNIMITYGGNVKIIDFGVAKSHFKEEKTESGVLKGKFAYMSPEQARGEPIDFRSDIFSLGILLWEMLTGERLFKRKTNQDTVKAVQKFKVPSIKEYRKDLPDALDEILQKCLNRTVHKRYQDASDMAVDLERLLFSLNSDFKPFHVAQFIYYIFSQESQVQALSAAFPVKNYVLPIKEMHPEPESVKQPFTPIKTEEITKKEKMLPDDDLTPLQSIVMKKPKPLLWMTIAILMIFIFGTLYVYLSHRKSKMAYLILDGMHAEMKVFVDDKQILSGFDKIQLFSGHPYKLRVRQKNYEDYAEEIFLNPQEKRKLQIVLKKNMPQYGDLTIHSQPSGAIVYVDGMEWAEKTPVTIHQLKAGKSYKIGIFKKDYKFETRDINVVGGKETRIDSSLDFDYATLKINSEPAGATVFIDGKNVGLTPLEEIDIKPNHDVVLKITKEFYQSFEQTLNLPPRELKNLHIDLTLEENTQTIPNEEIPEVPLE